MTMPDAPPTREPLKRHIILVGMPGSGKSSIGYRLAEVAGRPYVDTDSLIEGRCRRTISAIFAEMGEKQFRVLEEDMVAKAVDDIDPAVISTGGGAILSATSRDRIWKEGFVVYLKTPTAILLKRVSKDAGRPLLQTEDPEGVLKKLLAQRSRYYEQAHCIIDTGGYRVGDLASKIWKAYQRSA